MLLALCPSKLRSRRSKTSPLHFCRCATVAEVFTLLRCDLEAHTVMLFSFLKRGKHPFADGGEAGATAVTLKKSAESGSFPGVQLVVDAALIKPLPYNHPGRLVSVYEVVNGCPLCNISYRNYQDWKWSDLPFSSIEAWGWASYLLRSAETTESCRAPTLATASSELWESLLYWAATSTRRRRAPLLPRRWSKPVTPGYLIGYSKTRALSTLPNSELPGRLQSYCKQRTRWAIRNRQSPRAALAWRLQYSHA